MNSEKPAVTKRMKTPQLEQLLYELPGGKPS
jgi:hypothetical protein